MDDFADKTLDELIESCDSDIEMARLRVLKFGMVVVTAMAKLPSENLKHFMPVVDELVDLYHFLVEKDASNPTEAELMMLEFLSKSANRAEA
jgi:hypothetical protein